MHATTAAIAAIVLLASLVQGVAGFAFALVSLGLLARLLGIGAAVGLVSIFGLMVSLIQLVQLRGHVDRDKVAPLLLGMVCGTPIGLAFLRSASPRALELALGCLLVCYALVSLSGRWRPARPIPDRFGLLAGLAGGVLGGAFSTSGPPVVAYTTAKQWDKDAAKGSLAAFFTASSLLQIPLFAGAGLITRETLRLNLLLAPLMLAGIWAGTRIYQRIDQQRFRQVLLGLLLLLGCSYLIR